MDKESAPDDVTATGSTPENDIATGYRFPIPGATDSQSEQGTASCPKQAVVSMLEEQGSKSTPKQDKVFRIKHRRHNYFKVGRNQPYRTKRSALRRIISASRYPHTFLVVSLTSGRNFHPGTWDSCNHGHATAFHYPDAYSAFQQKYNETAATCSEEEMVGRVWFFPTVVSPAGVQDNKPAVPRPQITVVCLFHALSVWNCGSFVHDGVLDIDTGALKALTDFREYLAENGDIGKNAGIWSQRWGVSNTEAGPETWETGHGTPSVLWIPQEKSWAWQATQAAIERVFAGWEGEWSIYKH